MPSRSSPNSRTGPALRGALGLWLVLLSGCGRPPAPAVSFLTAPRQGHVYLARLVNEHPLYEQYRRLEQEIAALQAGCPTPLLSPVPLELGEMFLPGPELPRFPLEQFEHRREAWLLTLLPEPTTTATTLAPDLEAELRWRRQRLDRDRQRQIELVTAREEECVARLRAAAVRARQEALNNAGLDLKLPEREAQEAADKERRRLWDEIEAETAVARAQASQRIAEQSARIEAEARAQMSAAEAETRARMEKRLAVFAKTGSETPQRMSKAVAPPQPPAGAEAISWRPAETPPSAPFQPTLGPLLEGDRRTRLAQAARLAAQRAELGAALFEATALAVRRVAGLHDWEIYFPPEEPARGADMTDRVRPELRRMFQPTLSS